MFVLQVLALNLASKQRRDMESARKGTRDVGGPEERRRVGESLDLFLEGSVFLFEFDDVVRCQVEDLRLIAAVLFTSGTNFLLLLLEALWHQGLDLLHQRTELLSAHSLSHLVAFLLLGPFQAIQQGPGTLSTDLLVVILLVVARVTRVLAVLMRGLGFDGDGVRVGAQGRGLNGRQGRVVVVVVDVEGSVRGAKRRGLDGSAK